MDLAQLGLSIRSDGVVVASDRLEKMERQAKKTETATDKLVRQTERMSKSVGRAGRNLTIGLTAPLTAVSAAAVKLAIDAEETANKFDVVFRGSVKAVDSQLKELTRTIPLTQTQMRGLASGVQDLLVPLGLARDQAAGLSVQAISLAGDLSSFNNVGTDEVLNAITSALAGSSEPLRRYGVDVRETRLKTIAFNEGLIRQGQELTSAARAQAVFAAITADSSDALGDAARTVDSSANGLKFIRRDIRQAGEAIGNDLLPVARDLIDGVRDITKGFSELTPEGRKNVLVYAAIVAGIGPVLTLLASLTRSVIVLRAAVIALNRAALLNPFVAIPALLAAATVALITMRNDGVKPLTVGMRALSDEAKQATEQINNAFKAIEVVEVDNAISVITEEIKQLEAALNRSAFSKFLNDTAGLDDQLRGQIAALRDDRNVLLERAEALEKNTEAQVKSAESSKTSLTTTQNSVTANQEFAQSLAALSAELAGPMAVAQLEYNTKLNEAKALRAEGKIGVDQLAMAESLYRQELEANVQAISASIEMHDAHIVAFMEHAAAAAETATSIDQTRQSIIAETAALQGGLQARREFERASFIDQATPQFDPELAEEFKDEIAEIRKLAGELYDELEQGRAQDAIENLTASFHPLADQMLRLGEIIEQIDLDLNNGLISEAQAGIAKFGTVANASFDAMKSGLNQASSEYKALEKAQKIINIGLGIAAILQQGLGDPYTAIPRMIAMAALVASLGVETGSISGGASARRQERQGTGSVLGDAQAQSESILNATEITASAVSQLPGINRGIRNAIMTLNDRIGGASNQIARGASDVDFSGVEVGQNLNRSILGVLDPIGSFLDGIIGGLLGFGKTKLEDQGIALIGGFITDLTQGAVGQAFADLKRKGLFGTKRQTAFGDLDDGLNNQLNLVFQSLIDTTTQAALALGIPLDIIESRIAQFEVEAQQISLLDLSPDEQQAALQAVFSKIFDDLAAAVVPFIGQFQKAGEGTAEALIRVATSVQVAQQAFDKLSLNIDQSSLSAEQLAQASVGLVEAAGGIDNFIAGSTSFFNEFATDAQKFESAESDVTSALSELGIEVPKTAEELFKLIGTFDPLTEEGQRAIALLLELTPAFRVYFDALEEGKDAAEAAAQAERERIESLNDILNEALGIELNPLQEINRQFDDLRDSAIDLGASQQQLLLIEFARQNALLAYQAQLEESVASLIDRLTGVESGASQAVSSVGSLGDSFRDLSGVADNLRATIRQIQGVDGRSTLDPIGQRDFLQSQFDAAIASGDFETANSIALSLVDAIRNVGASSSDADNRVLGIIAALESAALQADQFTPPSGQQVGAIQVSAASIEQSAFEQVQLAQQLIQELTQLASLDQDVLALLESNGFSLGELVGLIGIDLNGLMADQVGILGGLAESFGLSLMELEEALGISLGELSDATSLLNDGLEQAINGLPPEIAGPLLEALAQAERTGNVGPLEDLVADLAPGFRNELAPFFDAINITTQAEAQVSELVKINTGIDAMQAQIARVADNLAAQNSNLGLPTFASGGIATRASIFGEAGAEAAIPLPDGRTVPVTLSGGTSSKGTESLLKQMKDQNEQAARLLQKIEQAITKSGQDQTRELARSNRIKESQRA